MGLGSFYKRTTIAVKRRSKENWGFPLVAAFLLLLLSAAVLTATGQAALAEDTADIAYFALAAGVIFLLAGLGQKKRGEVSVHGSS
jgi:hypothetical protein